MYRAVRAGRRHPLLIACAAGLAITGASSGAALAGSPYTVAVTVAPSQIPLHGVATVTASGNSANLSRLRVFLNRTALCQLTAAGDAAIATDVLLIKATVVHAYTKARAFGGKFPGNHLVCAYLTSVPPPSPTLLRAHASAPFVVG